MEFSAALRLRYPDSRRCSYVVDDCTRAPENIAVRAMNFGQHWRTENIVDVGYRIELPLSFVRDFLADMIAEYIDDAKAHPDPASEVDRALELARWPSVPRILETASLLGRFTDLYGHDLVLRWFGDGEPSINPVSC